ncbi:MAG: peptidoglycan DD-metalloendopeptidase family protein [Bacteroidia bacterium]|nr:peptidoglycan DD-metalloendopeptidase family protein [Bacteroidia bacterium]
MSSKITFSGNDPHKHKNDSVPNSNYKQISKSQLIIMIDSLLEKENVTPEEIEKIKYFSNLLKYKNVATYETEFDDLSNLHFYSESEEKLLFPPFPLDSMPREFNLQLENSSTKNYTNPFNGIITSYYGWRDKRMHKGIDIDLNKGEPVVAAFDGKVRIAQKNKGGFGNLVIIMHANGLETVYAHLSKIKVKEGQVVLSGQTIGLGGNTGRSRGSHLHFETRYKGHAINPLHFISYNDNKLHFQSVTFKVSKKGITAFPSNAELHTVKKGESWNRIALNYQTSVSKLLLLNGSAKRYYLRPGQQLRVN